MGEAEGVGDVCGDEPPEEQEASTSTEAATSVGTRTDLDMAPTLETARRRVGGHAQEDPLPSIR
ncbi:hypothetical protein GCM10009737_20700 [Nocardioides lentus]|uniref:Uncharacterized protein n=1 Tax=Nocardioides lentus TaxID=338077 RepID=A0ABN2PDP2_9ACTN